MEQIMVAVPEKYRDLFGDKKAFADLATLMPDGSPQVTPVWFDYVDGVIRVNTALGRTKARNMREGAPVALSILDPDNPYRYVQIRGTVSRVTTDGADAHIDALSHKYLGKDYPWRDPASQRIICEITPSHVSASG
jgi:PPOX class probable F420-dependent enzyme